MINNSKRREKDVMKLMMSSYDVALIDEKTNEFYVTLQGPIDSAYEGVSLY